MITLKSPHEIDLMRRSGKITAAARALAGEMVKPGVTTREIDKAVYAFIIGSTASVIPLRSLGPCPGWPKFGTSGLSCILLPIPWPTYSRTTEYPFSSA